MTAFISTYLLLKCAMANESGKVIAARTSQSGWLTLSPVKTVRRSTPMTNAW